MTDSYFLQVDAGQLSIAVYLNGISMLVEGRGLGIHETQPVNLWLKPSNNVLQVMLTQPEIQRVKSPTDSSVESQSEKVDINLFLHDKAKNIPTILKSLAHFQWPLAGVSSVYPYRWSYPIAAQISGLPTSLLWGYAAHTENLSPVDRQAMTSIIFSLAGLLQQKRLEEAFQIMRFRYQDEAVAEGKPIARIKSAVLELWEVMLGNDSLEYLPVPNEQLLFAVVGEKNIVRVSKENGSPAIEFIDRSAKNTYGIPIYFASINGQWIIIR
jgi:hypothetical protein